MPRPANVPGLSSGTPNPDVAQLVSPEPLPAPGTVVDGIIQITGADGTTKTYQRESRLFEDTVNWFVEYDGWEQWRILNLGANPPVERPRSSQDSRSPIRCTCTSSASRR